MSNGWIGVDLDGTMAEYTHWQGPTHIGAPIPAMVDRVREWVAKGIEVRIFTARVSGADREAQIVRDAITSWLLSIGLPPLRVTCVKDYHMVSLWDDRAVHVVTNTGEAMGACRASGFSSYREAEEV